MSGQLFSVLVALSVFSSAAIALTVTPSEDRAYPAKADFDWTFAQFPTASAFDTERSYADRESIRMVGLKRMNLGQLRE
jgi:hypothetical protein